MKRIYILLLMTFMLCGCDTKKTNDELTINKDVIEKEENKIIEPEVIYQDNNPIKLSLYVDDNGALKKADFDYHTPWVLKKDIVVFDVVLSEDEHIDSNYFQDIWQDYAEKYDNINYKVAWYINFTLKDGTKYEKIISNPRDVQEFYDYLEIYLYDSYHQQKGVWYSHLLEEEMNDETIITSMKLTAGSKFEEIVTPIEVMTFTYDTPDDINNNFYRGNSKYLVNVYND